MTNPPISELVHALFDAYRTNDRQAMAELVGDDSTLSSVHVRSPSKA